MAASVSSNLVRVRDPKYYFKDGNTIILVENTLFNVHRSILCQDQSAFEAMFSCPSGGTDVTKSEGESDDNPIRLQGDTVQQVRALMWSLYALAHERQNDSHGTAALHKFCLLARIAHKYHFQSTETWALETVAEFFAKPRTGSNTPELVEATNIAVLCQHARLIKLVTGAWMGIVQSAKDPSKILDLSLAIRVAEQHGLSLVLGRAYYAMMILGRDHWGQDGVLDRSQRLRLLSGFHDLALQCRSLPTQAAPAITHRACNSPYRIGERTFSPSDNRCKLGWPSLWKAIFHQRSLQIAFNALSPADLVGRLLYIEKHLQTFHGTILANTNYPMTTDCLALAAINIGAMADKYMENMPFLFVDPN